MNKQDIMAFKKELENYSYYKTNLQGTKKLIEYNEYLLENVHGVDPSKAPSGSGGGKVWVETDTYHRISDELERLRNRYALRIAQISYIESILDKLDPETKEMCIAIYVEGETYATTTSGKHITSSGLFKRIERKLSKID